MRSPLFNMQRFITAAFFEKAVEWSKIPGASIDDKIEWLSQEILNLVREGHVREVLDLYAVLMDASEMPAKDKQNMSEEARKAQQQIKKLTSQMLDSNPKKADELAKKIAERFNNNPSQFLRQITARAFFDLRARFAEPLVGVLPAGQFRDPQKQAVESFYAGDQDSIAREAKSTLRKLKQEIRKIILRYRERYVEEAAQELEKLKQELQAEFPDMTDSHFIAVLWSSKKGGSDSPSGIGEITVSKTDENGNTVIVPIFSDRATEVFNKKETIVKYLGGPKQDQGAHQYWSQRKDNPEARNPVLADLFPTPMPFNKESILTQLGYAKTVGSFVRGSEFWKPYDMDESGDNFYEGGHNWNMIRNLVIQHFPDGEGLGDIITTDIDTATGLPKSRPETQNTPEKRAIYSFWKGVCGNNIEQAREKIKEALQSHYIDPATGRSDYKGFERLIKSVGSRSQIDDHFMPNYVLTMDSNAEKELMGVLRGDFGLQAVPMHTNIETMPDCPNPDSFLIDFMMPCDYYAGINEGGGHPEIRENVAFVGEYFDNNRTMPHMIKDGESIFSARGDLLYVGPTTIEKSEHYDIVKQWKVMTEATVAEATGNQALFFTSDDLDDKSRRNIMKQLDHKAILYHSNKCPLNDNSCAVAFHMLERHYAECKDQANCPARFYLASQQDTPQRVAKTHTKDEAYLMVMIARYKVTQGVNKVVKSQPYYSRDVLYGIHQKRKSLQNQRLKVWKEYQAATNEPRRIELAENYNRLSVELNRLEDTDLRKAYQAYTSENDVYQEGLKILENMLEQVRKGDSTLTSAQIELTVKNLFKEIKKREAAEARRQRQMERQRAASKAFNWKRFAAGQTHAR